MNRRFTNRSILRIPFPQKKKRHFRFVDAMTSSSFLVIGSLGSWSCSHLREIQSNNIHECWAVVRS